jgi:pimeloyl-ACP methyl ester carboxylesterase
LGRTADANGQVERAVRHILEHHHASRLSLIAHSWGSMPACRFAGDHPVLVDRIVLFAPIARRPTRRYKSPPDPPAWRVVTLEDQWARFVEDTHCIGRASRS